MSKKVFFKPALGSQIGLGHAYRCISLAGMLPQDFRSCVIIPDNQKQYAELFSGGMDEVRILASFQDMRSEAENLINHCLERGSIIVLDGYEFDVSYQQVLKDTGVFVVSVDDFGEGRFVSDVVINHGCLNPRYDLPSYTICCTGPEYFMGRKSFREAASNKRKTVHEVTDIFVCFGGADPLDLTMPTVKTLRKMVPESALHVVTGPDYQGLEKLSSFTVESGRVHLYRNLDAQGMLDVMKHCQTGVVAASSVAMEACCAGLGLLVVAYTENQYNIASMLSQLDMAVMLTLMDYSQWPGLLLNTTSFLDPNVIQKHLASQQQHMTDSRPRIAQVFNDLYQKSKSTAS
ncbi:MAG: UDP-2,4-diacetamido-2,4,6-trideoxy-beta-L-altropyranose hydrolase [Flavobacteriales bacterium]|nr:UDP-2,4-diacetamido-2,4,6-trideoxy-beta-L-altropyranose hydrolase [Flavobacteriales bacterium]